MENKTCPMCGITKPTTDFYLRDAAIGRLHAYCKACMIDRSARYRRKIAEMAEADPDIRLSIRAKDAARKARSRINSPVKAAVQSARDRAAARKNVAKFLIGKARARAKERGILFAISEADIIVPAVCPVLGTPMEFARSSMDTSPTLDRIIPVLGYVPGNVRVISFRANRIKNDATLAELQRVVAYLETALAHGGVTSQSVTNHEPVTP